MSASLELTAQRRKIKADLILLIIILGMGVAALFHYVCGFYLKLPYPRSTFLQRPSISLSDFIDLYSALFSGNPYSNPVIPYPAFSFVPFFWIKYLEFLPAYAIYLAIYLGVAAWFVLNQLQGFSVCQRLSIFWVLCLASYPALFCFDRGNIELFIWIFLAFFTYFYTREKWMLSALFLAAAIAMKIYPIFFVFLLVQKGKWKPALCAVGGAILLLVISTAILPGTLFESLSQLKANLSLAVVREVVGPQKGYTISLFNLCKAVWLNGFSMPISSLGSLNRFYSGFFVFSSLAVCFFVSRWEARLWKKYAFIVAAFLLLPSISYDYKLLHLVFPVLLFLNDDEVQLNKIDYASAVILALLFVPKAYVIVERNVSLAIFINPLLLLCLCVLVTRPQQPSALETTYSSPELS